MATTLKHLIKTARETIGRDTQQSRPPCIILNGDWLKDAPDKLPLKLVYAQKARQAQAVIGGKMALTSQGTKKKVCYYYDGKNCFFLRYYRVFIVGAKK